MDYSIDCLDDLLDEVELVVDHKMVTLYLVQVTTEASESRAKFLARMIRRYYTQLQVHVTKLGKKYSVSVKKRLTPIK